MFFAAGLNTPETISVVVGGVIAFGVLVAMFDVWTGYVHERRRSQPIVIAHELRGRHFSDSPDYLGVLAFLTCEGGGPAFNVRFGVEFDGVRFPQKMVAADPDIGNVQRVLRHAERRPTTGAWPVLVPSKSLLAKSDETRTYWARYENARGQTWETSNPWDRSARLEIRRVRAVWWRQWREQRRRNEAWKLGKMVEEAALRAAHEAIESMRRDQDAVTVQMRPKQAGEDQA
jgi:hypothetical protein